MVVAPAAPSRSEVTIAPPEPERSLPIARNVEAARQPVSTALTAEQHEALEPEAAPPRSSAPPPSLFGQRLQSAGQWILTQADDAYTIQILTEADAEFLKLYLRSLPKAVDTDRIFVYRSSANAKPLYTVVFGAFPSPREAMDAIGGLPPELTRYLPYPRSFKVVRAEYEAGRLRR